MHFSDKYNILTNGAAQIILKVLVADMKNKAIDLKDKEDRASYEHICSMITDLTVLLEKRSDEEKKKEEIDETKEEVKNK